MSHVIVTVLIYLIVQMGLVWVIYRIVKNPSVVDVSWSLGLMTAGLIYLWSIPMTPRSYLISALIIIWALRLAGYLWFTRIRRGHVDKRYTKLSTDWKISKSLGFFLNFQLQGLLIFFISFIFYLISTSNKISLSLVDGIAIGIVALGIVGESVADFQITRFKHRQKGGVCTIGLWNYSRHPNYFFDWLTWLGFTIFAIQSQRGYLGIASLILLYVIFTRVTGPLTERSSVQSRGQKYIDYQKQTSMFFPWFKGFK